MHPAISPIRTVKAPSAAQISTTEALKTVCSPPLTRFSSLSVFFILFVTYLFVTDWQPRQSSTPKPAQRINRGRAQGSEGLGLKEAINALLYAFPVIPLNLCH
jgi:hypothetical protein